MGKVGSIAWQKSTFHFILQHADIRLHIFLQILARDGENNENEKWTSVIGELAGSIFIKRPKKVNVAYI